MNCPVCDDKLREINRQGVSIEICPSCKGIWLDAGELDKLLGIAVSERSEIERPREDIVTSRQERGYAQRSEYDDHSQKDSAHRRERDDYDHQRYQEYNRKKKPGSWIADILGGLGGDD